MKTLVATVSGIPVYSDKELNRASGTTVYFSDDSWCDVHSKDIHNATSDGFIQIGGAKDGNSVRHEHIPKTEGLTEGLFVSSIRANLVINTTTDSSSCLSVIIVGKEHLVDRISVLLEGNRLKVLGEDNINQKPAASSGKLPSSSNINIVNSRNIISGTAIYASSVRVGDSYGHENSFQTESPKEQPSVDKTDAVEIKISVPKGMSLRIDKITGDILVGDVEGDIRIKAIRNSSVLVGKVKKAHLSASGNALIKVDSVEEDLTMICDGGIINVLSGSVDVAGFSISGDGSVFFYGEAKDVAVDINGSGRVLVSFVKKPIPKECGLFILNQI